MGRSDELGGVRVSARMSIVNVDRPPLGDIAASLATMVVTNPAIEFRVRVCDGGDRVSSLRGPDVARHLAEIVAFQDSLA